MGLPLAFMLLILSQLNASPLVAGLDLWTVRGKLSNVNSSLEVITQLSKNLQQSATWWQLSSTDWHPEALWRFMVLGPPPQGTTPNTSWGIQDQLRLLQSGCLSATKAAAIAQYTAEVGRSGTGRIKLDAWLLTYLCLTTECDYITPVVLTRELTGKLSFSTLWQSLFSSSPSIPILVTTSTADLINTVTTKISESTPTMHKNLQLRVAENLRQCSESIALVQAPVDAAYKVSPGICYVMAETLRKALNQTRILVILVNQPHEEKWPYVKRPLHECSNAPVVMKNLENFRTCAFSQARNIYYCTNFTLGSYVGTTCGTNREKIGVANFLLVYSYLNNQTSSSSLNETFQTVNDTVPEAPCSTSGRTKAAIFSSMHYKAGFDLTHSVWDDTRGARTQELELGRQNGNFCHYGLKSDHGDTLNLLRCNITKALNSTVERCEESAVSESLLNVLLNETVTAYADEHNTAFNVDKGPATDLFTAWATLVTAAVSVVTATVPCTNLELEYLARYVFPAHHHKLKWLKYTLLAFVNVGLGCVLYTPIFAMIINESKRAEPYYSWALFANDVIVNTYGSTVRGVFIVEAESVYRSQILWIFVVVCSISFFLIVLITIRRSKKVFHRRRLLLEERSRSRKPISKSEMKEINVKAIEMGLSEFVNLRDRLKGNKQSSEESQI